MIQRLATASYRTTGSVQKKVCPCPHNPGSPVNKALICCGPSDTISQGEPSVVIGNQDSARYGDPTVHGGKLVAGCPTVIIGSSAQAEALKTDKPFCEECERKRKEREAAEKRRQAMGS